jgi:replicative DNA helicase
MLNESLNQNEVEAGYLASCIMFPDSFARTADRAKDDLFVNPRHKAILAAIRAMPHDQAWDYTYLRGWLRDNGKFDACGGAVYLSEILPMGMGNVESYLELLESFYAKSQVRQLCRSAINDVDVPGVELLDRVEAEIINIHQRLHRGGGFVKLSEVVPVALACIEKRLEAGRSVTGVPTGFTDLDNSTCGLQPGDLIVVAGYPSRGKSVIAEQWSFNAARLRFPTLFFSLEMSQQNVMDRAWARETPATLMQIRNGTGLREHLTAVRDASGRFVELPLWLDATPGLSITGIVARARMASLRHHIGLVVIDYLQLIVASRQRGDSQEAEISETVRQLKNLARELNAPVVLLSQLRRPPIGSRDPSPSMQDLKGCLPGHVLVTTDTGARKRIDQMKNSDRVQAWNGRTGKFESSSVSRVIDNGVRQTIKMGLRSGRTIECTGNHPLMREGTWVPARDIVNGDVIAVPRFISGRVRPDSSVIGDDMARLAGYMIGDGYCQRSRSCGFINTDQELLSDVETIVGKNFPLVGIRRRKAGTSTELNFHQKSANGYGKPGGNSLRNWLMDVGLGGKRHSDKEIPEVFFSATDREIWNLLAGLWATDGTVVERHRGGRVGYDIRYATTSRKLASDVQAILSCVGVSSVVDRGYTGKAAKRPIYNVRVSSASWPLLACMPLRGHKAARLANAASRRMDKDTIKRNSGIDRLPPTVSEYYVDKYGYSRSWRNAVGFVARSKRMSRARADELAVHTGDELLLWWSRNDLNWDEVVSISGGETCRVWDLALENHHNFIADGVLVHNSGGIESHADLVILVHRPNFEATKSQGLSYDDGELIIGKQRNGPLGMMRVRFDCRHVRFQNATRGPEADVTAAGRLEPVPGEDLP